MLNRLLRWPSLLFVTAVLGASLAVVWRRYPAFADRGTDAVCLLAIAVAFACLLFSAGRRHRADERMPLYLFGAGLLVFAIGQLVLPGLSYFTRLHCPPILSAILFLLGHVLLGIGLLLNGGRYPKSPIGIISVTVDGIITVFAFIVVLLQREIDATVAPRGPVGAELVGWGYAAGILLMLVCLVISLSATLPVHQRGPQRLLLLGIGLVLLGDEVLRQFPAIHWDGAFPSSLLLWTLGYPLFGIAACWEHAARPKDAVQARDADEFLGAGNMAVPMLLITAETVLILLNTRGVLDSEHALLLVRLFVLLACALLVRFFLYVIRSRMAYLALLARVRESERMSVTDALTSLPNKRACMQRLEDELARARRYQRPFTVIFGDIDFFKLINDVHGHQVGDIALIAVGKYLRSRIRNTDMVARLGGEEFVLILPETSVNGATILAERLRDGIANMPLFTPQGQELHLTISLGIAGYPETSETVDDLLNHADEAMQRAKESGRNRVMTAKAKVSVFKAE
ncbi:MAG: GGDEF domain-containing protein [Armatimonadota bacterium]